MYHWMINLLNKTNVAHRLIIISSTNQKTKKKLTSLSHTDQKNKRNDQKKKTKLTSLSNIHQKRKMKLTSLSHIDQKMELTSLSLINTDEYRKLSSLFHTHIHIHTHCLKRKFSSLSHAWILNLFQIQVAYPFLMKRTCLIVIKIILT